MPIAVAGAGPEPSASPSTGTMGPIPSGEAISDNTAGEGGGGVAGAGGASTGSGNATGTAGTTSTAAPTWVDCPRWPPPSGDEDLSGTREISGSFDGELRRYIFHGNATDEIFRLNDGATLKNVIIGSPGADGIHCEGSCTLENVWWEDVGEDAATADASDASDTMTIDCGGARRADDKVFQHNGPGTVIIRRFFVEDFGKLYRSCGNCDTQYERHVQVEDVIAKIPGGAVVGVNSNYGDTADIGAVYLYDPSRTIRICERYEGNDTGAEPVRLGAGSDPDHCRYAASSIVYTPQ